MRVLCVFFGCANFDEFARIIKTYTPDERYRNLTQFLAAVGLS